MMRRTGEPLGRLGRSLARFRTVQAVGWRRALGEPLLDTSARRGSLSVASPG
jgi:hypothetical protein